MIRTRDFFLFLIATALAVTLTGFQVFSVYFGELVPNHLTLAETTPDSYAVVSPEDPEVARQSRLTAMREKLSSLRDNDNAAAAVVAMAEENNLEAEGTGGEEESPTEANVSTAVSSCLSGNFAGNWNAQTIEIVDTGTERVVVEKTAEGSEITRAILPKFPRAGGDTCISSDVIGIALDGSLIRNNEHGVYGVFGEGTLIGYALDGYPIYGQTSSLATDSCGAVSIDGAYRYYLSLERPGVIGCFRGTPVSII